MPCYCLARTRKPFSRLNNKLIFPMAAMVLESESSRPGSAHDILLNFTDHLRSVSVQAGIPIFLNDNELSGGKNSCTDHQLPFAEAFEMREEMEKVNKWRKGLVMKAADLSGWEWDLTNMANGNGSKSIEKIVEDALDKLDHKYLHVARHQVGIESGFNKIILLLGIDTNDVCNVAIYGMGGVGKTAITEVAVNKLC